MSHPYNDLPPSQFWRTAVGERTPFTIEGLWKPKFRIRPRTRFATAGSCFAQHISRALVARGYRWVDAEPAPSMMSEQTRHDYYYGTFSFRTGNIYTPNMLLQWLNWANGVEQAPDVLWEKDGRFYDPFRPAVEPRGFETRQEALASRAVTIKAVRAAIEEANVLVFTLGLTECWQDGETGVEYAVCPGTVAGEFDPDRHKFVNHDYPATFASLKAAIIQLRLINPNIGILLTVSPVPITATNSNEHVLNASSYLKSVLRAVAGGMVAEFPFVDYFPSYELIVNPVFHGMHYSRNQRNVEKEGVDFVMAHFHQDQRTAFAKTKFVDAGYGTRREVLISEKQDLVDKGLDDQDEKLELRCEEEILDAFS